MARWTRILVLIACTLAACTSLQPESRQGTETLTPTTSTTDPEYAFEVEVTDSGGEPISGATVTIEGRSSGRSGTTGTIEVEIARFPATLQVTADGYRSVLLTVGGKPVEPFSTTLERRVLAGVVTDGGGHPMKGVTVISGDHSAVTGSDGGFLVEGAVPGSVSFWRPGWATTTIGWRGGSRPMAIEMAPQIVKAFHIAGSAVQGRWQELLGVARSTEINGLMVDLKDESGRVFYPTSVEIAIQAGAVAEYYNLARVVADSSDLYLIGRIVTFQDPIAARAFPDLAVWDTARNAPFRKGGQYFLDPTDPNAQDYALELAEEACRAGFDEIQFDYVRYPDGFGTSARFDLGSERDVRMATIAGFLERAGQILHPLGCAVAADIFGFITSTPDDGGIGQQLEQLSEIVDVLSPMLYPSHYSTGWFGFAVPNNHPGPVVSAALDDGLARLDVAVIIRPWLQDFYYNAGQVRAQIDAAQARGMGWMLWNANSNITLGALAD